MMVKREGYPVSRVCRLMELPRSSYYYTSESSDPPGLVSAIESVLDGFPTYGTRRVSQQLRRPPHEIVVNRKRTRRIMAEKGWLQAIKRRKVRTTNSEHPYPRYPNLVKELAVEQPDQVWVADITYIRLSKEFIYLAVVLDVFTRVVRGWCLSRQIDQHLSLAALEMALEQHTPQIHHSDQGVQYAALAYTQLLTAHQVAISMAAIGKAEENGYAERFMRTIKEEEVDLSEYRDFGDALSQIGHFIEDVYNHKRIHSALGYLTPAEFERAWGLARTLPAQPAPLSRA